MAARKDAFKKGLSERGSSERLKELSTSMRKEKRSTEFKRFRSGDQLETMGMEEGQPSRDEVEMNDAALQQAIRLVQANENKAQVMEGMLTMRRFLCSRDAPIQAIIDSGIIRTFIALLACNDEPLVTEIVWCLTNIATGDHAQTGEVIGAASSLLRVVGDESFSATLKEQVCWTIGNVAGDSDHYRQILLQHGALQSLSSFLFKSMDLLQLLLQQPVLAGSDSDSGSSSQQVHNAITVASDSSGWSTAPAASGAAALSAALTRTGTVCWALSNLARGTTTAAAFIGSGVVPPLLGLMQLAEQQRQQKTSTPYPPGSHTGCNTILASESAVASMRSLMVDVSWIFVFLTAKEEDAVDALLQQGIVEALVALLQTAHSPSASGGLFTSPEDPQLVIPVLRCLGNVGHGPPEWREVGDLSPYPHHYVYPTPSLMTILSSLLFHVPFRRSG